MRLGSLATVWILVVTAFSAGRLSAQARDSVEAAAQKILEKNCLSCHGDVQMSGLDLRSRDALLKGGKRGPSVVPGNAKESLLYQAVLHAGDLKMPMGKDPLSESDRELLGTWINEGARWDDTVQVASESDWWAFETPKQPEPPAVNNEAWVRNAIDSFILARIEEKGLTPAAQADKTTLARRLYFDLHGVPPTPDEVRAFVNDESPKADEKLVDRLLESPRYGERWGRHWLDVVRYADTGGFETDIFFPNAWRYRDYVIKSFNDDKPFDRFLKEQIAGDEIWPDDIELRGGYEIPEQKQRHLEARIGTGLYTVGTVYHEAALDGNRLRYEWMVDAIDTTGEAFLGLTIGCARCHDHKFDPISQKDYHRMMAVFAGSEIRQLPVVNKMSEFGYYSAYPRQIKVFEYQAAIKRLDSAVRRRVIDEIAAKFPPDLVEVFRIPKVKRTKDQELEVIPIERAITEAGLRENAAGYKRALPYTSQERDRRATLITDLGKAASGVAFELQSATVLGHSDVIYPVHMTSRGDWRSKGEKVTPGVPAVLSNGEEFAHDEPDDRSFVPERRRKLAEWLAGPDHPLTARVIVNRIWQGHFSRGLVTTPNNFGRQGQPPTHPKLLDWLATDFVQQGWSIKKLHKQILLSSAYQMSTAYNDANAEIDSENQYLWRMNRRRLEAETLRDSVLAVSGTINWKAGGRPVLPPLTEEERLGMWDVDDWPESMDPADHNRRSVYVFVKRQFPYPMFTTFDAPDSSTSCGRRDTTTVAPQALTLLNSNFMIEKAGALASRLREDFGDDPEAWVDGAWNLAFARPPSDEERRRALDMFTESSAPDSELTRFALMVFNLNEFLYVD